MGDGTGYDACMGCRVLYRRGQDAGGRCTRCGGPLTEAPERVVRAKERARQRRRRQQRADHGSAADATRAAHNDLPRRATPMPEELGSAELLRSDRKSGPGQTMKVPMQTVGPVRSSSSVGESSSDALRSGEDPGVDALLEALQSAPIPDDNSAERTRRAPSFEEEPVKEWQPSAGSLFIPLDSFTGDGASASEGPPQRKPRGGLFASSGSVGDSGITATNEQARKGQLGRLESPVTFGEYVLEEVLGRGGMGVVYRAFQPTLGRRVALKLMSSQNIAEEDRARFQREARAAARLRHPHIVPIFDIGSQDGHDFFTLELIEGTDLHKLAKDGMVTIEESLEIVRKVAEAIDYAHKQGVIHRDLKPQNILIDAQGEPHVTDFGLAKDLQDAVNLTTPGIALGSPPYMPPEQAMGQYDQVDEVSDVYGLGSVLYECLTGRPPFVGETAYEILARVQSEEPPAPSELEPEVDRDIEVICLKALDKVKALRYQGALELAEDLARCQRGDPIHARPPSLTRRWGRRLAKNRPAFVAASFSAAMLVWTALLVADVTLQPKPPPPPSWLAERGPEALGDPLEVAAADVERGNLQGAITPLAAALGAASVEADRFVREVQAPLNLPLEMQSHVQEAQTNSASGRIEAARLAEALRASAQFGGWDAEVARALLRGYVGLALSASGPAESAPVLERIGASAAAHESASFAEREALAGFAAEGILLLCRALDLERKAHAPWDWVELCGQAQDAGLTRALARYGHRRADESRRQDLEQAFAARPFASGLGSDERRPILDQTTGQVRAPLDDARSRWLFPEVPLAGAEAEEPEGPPEVQLEGWSRLAEEEGVELRVERPDIGIRRLRRAGRAAWPTSPVVSADGGAVFVGWLGALYELEATSGRLRQSWALPGRAAQLRRGPDQTLWARCLRPSGVDARKAATEDVVLDLTTGLLRRPAEEGGGELQPAELVRFEPLAAEGERLAAEARLGWGRLEWRWAWRRMLLDHLARPLSDSQRNRRKTAKGEVEKALDALCWEVLGEVEAARSAGSSLPWMEVCGLRALAWLADSVKADPQKVADLERRREGAREALEAWRGDRRWSSSPFAEVRLAVALEAEGEVKLSQELLRAALARLQPGQRYEPRLAGHGELDPGAVLTRRLEACVIEAQAIAASPREGAAEQLEAMARRTRDLEGWRDAFAPARALSAESRALRSTLLGGTDGAGGRQDAPAPLPAGSPERLSGAYAGVGLASLTAFDKAIIFGGFYAIAPFLIAFVIAPLRRARRQQQPDFAALGWESWRRRWGAWFKEPTLRLQHSLLSYLSLRDRVAVLGFLAWLGFATALHDAIVTTLDTRERAPAALFAGLPGHRSALAWLHAEVTARGGLEDAAGCELLAYGLACAGEDALAARLYEALGAEPRGPRAFNAALLQGRVRETPAATLLSELEPRLGSDVFERHWARFALTREVRAEESARELAPARTELLRRYGELRGRPLPALVPPARAARDAYVAGRASWLSALPGSAFALLQPLRHQREVEGAFERVFGEDGGRGRWLLQLRRGFALALLAIVLFAASLALPARAITRSEDVALDGPLTMLVPGVAELQSGRTAVGAAMVTAFIALGFQLLACLRGGLNAGTLLPFERYSNLAGATTLSEPAVAIKLLVLLAAILGGLALWHAFELRRLRREDATRTRSSSGRSRGRATAVRPSLVNS